MNESEGGQGQARGMKKKCKCYPATSPFASLKSALDRVSLTTPMLIVMQCNAPALATVPGDLTEESGG
jgi:hypothetical protein